MTDYAVKAYGPAAGTNVSVTSTGSTPVALAKGRYGFISTAKTNIVFVASAAGTVAAATDVWMPADTLYVLDIISGRNFVSFYTASTATLVYAAMD